MPEPASCNVHGLIYGACDPYPSPVFNTDGHYNDHRRSQYLTEVLGRLSHQEIYQLARALGNLRPLDFELELQWIQENRDRAGEELRTGQTDV